MLTASDLELIANVSSQVGDAYAAALANGATFEEAVAASHAGQVFQGNTTYSANGQQLKLEIIDNNNNTNATVNSTSIKFQDASSNSILSSNTLSIGANVIVNTTALLVGANVTINTAAISIGNSTANLFANSVLTRVVNSTSSANLVPNALTIGTSVVNSTVIATAAGLFMNATAIKVPNNGLITATSATANGYTYLAGGVLMQWGWVAVNATAGDITFPIAFPTAVLSYQATSNSAVAGNTVGIIAANTTTMNVRTTSVAAASNSYWLAIGA
jgi:hypothetical protein